MRATTIITAKIEQSIYKLIEQGSKHYEVRDEGFHKAKAIQYINAETGEVLGLYWLGPEDDFNRTHDPLIQSLSGVDDSTFHRLFPENVDRLYVAPIWSHTSLDELFPEVAA